ncbi:MAG: hypothetical protein IPJ76_15760 [Flavobacteriales bacterium]|nr:MAG: hypothetical protein IPJ76_15760 [Flavobacteriales bacterium]
MSIAVRCILDPWIMIGASVFMCTCAAHEAHRYEPQRIEAEVRAMFEQYANAQRSQGLRGELPFLDTSNAFFWVPPGYAGPIGFDSVRTIVERTAPTLRAIDPRWRALRIEPMNDSMAAYTGELEAVTVGMNDNTTRTTLLETGFVVKRADGWKLLCGQTCYAPPEKEGP